MAFWAWRLITAQPIQQQQQLRRQCCQSRQLVPSLGQLPLSVYLSESMCCIDTASAGAGSGDPSDPSSFTASSRTTWRGRAIAVLRPTTLAAPPHAPAEHSGAECPAWQEVQVTATATGLAPGKLTITLCRTSL